MPPNEGSRWTCDRVAERAGSRVPSDQPLRARLAARADSPRFDDDPDRGGEGTDASASPGPDFQERLAFACGLSLVMPDGFKQR